MTSLLQQRLGEIYDPAVRAHVQHCLAGILQDTLTDVLVSEEDDAVAQGKALAKAAKALRLQPMPHVSQGEVRKRVEYVTHDKLLELTT